MVKVVVASLKPEARTRKDAAKVVAKRVRDVQGQVKTLRTIDFASDTFGEDLRYVFGRNVAKARKDNKKIVGANDVGPKR